VALTGSLSATKSTTGINARNRILCRRRNHAERTLSVPRDTDPAFPAPATFSAENSVYLTGSIGVQTKPAAQVALADGSTVQTTAVQIGGSGLSGFAGLNAAPGSSDQTGVSLSNLSFGYTLATPTDTQSGTDRRTWSTQASEPPSVKDGTGGC
jgi:hypothetical protein